jgi:bacillithiol system protein YtxJ
MKWTLLESEQDIAMLVANSFTKPQVIFKHSTRCSISSMALNRIDRHHTSPDADFYKLDLIQYRNISNKIATDFNVQHQSPQVLLIKDGTCVYDESHMGISMDELIEQLNTN